MPGGKCGGKGFAKPVKLSLSCTVYNAGEADDPFPDKYRDGAGGSGRVAPGGCRLRPAHRHLLRSSGFQELPRSPQRGDGDRRIHGGELELVRGSRKGRLLQARDQPRLHAGLPPVEGKPGRIPAGQHPDPHRLLRARNASFESHRGRKGRGIDGGRPVRRPSRGAERGDDDSRQARSPGDRVRSPGCDGDCPAGRVRDAAISSGTSAARTLHRACSRLEGAGHGLPGRRAHALAALPGAHARLGRVVARPGRHGLGGHRLFRGAPDGVRRHRRLFVDQPARFDASASPGDPAPGVGGGILRELDRRRGLARHRRGDGREPPEIGPGGMGRGCGDGMRRGPVRIPDGGGDPLRPLRLCACLRGMRHAREVRGRREGNPQGSSIPGLPGPHDPRLVRGVPGGGHCTFGGDAFCREGVRVAGGGFGPVRAG